MKDAVFAQYLFLIGDTLRACHVVLDEPTNHLDIASKEMRIEALTNYDDWIGANQGVFARACTG